MNSVSSPIFLTPCWRKRDAHPGHARSPRQRRTQSPHPAHRLRGTAEAALDAEPDATTCRNALLDSMEEADRVLTMLNTLMDISEAETGLMKLDVEPFLLDQLVSEVVELFEFVAQDKFIVVAAAVRPELTVNADRNRLRQVLVNLVDNALKYTPRGGHVEITAEPAPAKSASQ